MQLIMKLNILWQVTSETIGASDDDFQRNENILSQIKPGKVELQKQRRQSSTFTLNCGFILPARIQQN